MLFRSVLDVVEFDDILVDGIFGDAHLLDFVDVILDGGEFNNAGDYGFGFRFHGIIPLEVPY